MQGYAFKTVIALALSAVFLFPQAGAANTTNDMYKTKLGCMSCHQGEVAHSDKTSKQKSR